jgi:hypothetical protein
MINERYVVKNVHVIPVEFHPPEIVKVWCSYGVLRRVVMV